MLQKRYYVFPLLIVLLFTPLINYAQYTFTPPIGCGLGSVSSSNQVPAPQSYAVPATYSWTWGLDGRFSNISGTADQKNFYNWAKDPTRGGEYVLARVHYDASQMIEGRIVSAGTGASCSTQGIGIRFSPLTRDLSTEEFLGIYLANMYSVKTSSGTATIGGVGVNGKQFSQMQGASPTMTFGVAAYFNASRAIGSGGNVALPSTPFVVSGGHAPDSPDGGYAYYPLAGGRYSFVDAVFTGSYNGWGRIGACALQSSNAFCTYGPAASRPSFFENKQWRFDYIVHKPVGVSFSMPAMKDQMLPYIAIGRLYVFGTNGATTDGYISPEQMVVCIASMSAYPAGGKNGCSSTAPTNPQPPAPYDPTCVTVLQGGSVAGSALTTQLDDAVFADFTGTGTGFRYTQRTGQNNGFKIGIQCVNNNNTIPSSVKLTITDQTTCSDVTNPTARGVLCNSVYQGTETQKAKGNIQVFKALSNVANLACSNINSLGITGNSTFKPIPIGTVIDNAELASSYYSPLGDPNTYLWQFCARYYTEQSNASNLGGGVIQGKFNFTFDYQ